MTDRRLLTEQEAAAYLALPAATVRKLPFGHVRLGCRHRYDRKALDAHLDRVSGLDSSEELNVNKANAELARFIADHPDVAGGP
ncbi:MAG: hypothetical protein WC563_13640 [Brevundimonas sp.]